MNIVTLKHSTFSYFSHQSQHSFFTLRDAKENKVIYFIKYQIFSKVHNFKNYSTSLMYYCLSLINILEVQVCVIRTQSGGLSWLLGLSMLYTIYWTFATQY